MKIRMKTWQLAISFLLAVALPVCFITSIMRTSNAQTTEAACRGNHLTRKEFYQSARFLPPVTITEVTNNRLQWVSADKGIDLGSLELEDGYSIVPVGFSKEKHAGCYGIIYCDKHKTVLNMEKVPDEQCGVVKN